MNVNVPFQKKIEESFIIIIIIVSAYRYIAITTLAIIAVFLVYLRQFLMDLHQIYRHSSVPQNTSPWIFPAS